jgi:hypothetical protein
MIWYSMIWYSMIWYSMIRYSMIWYRMLLHFAHQFLQARHCFFQLGERGLYIFRRRRLQRDAKGVDVLAGALEMVQHGLDFSAFQSVIDHRIRRRFGIRLVGSIGVSPGNVFDASLPFGRFRGE